MRFKKRKKSSRQRGSTTHGWGARQRHKGHGCSGGRGMAGTGKRADQKKQSALMAAKKAGFKDYFGKAGMTSAKTKKKKQKKINLQDVFERFGNEKKIELKDYKILGQGEGFKGEIVAGGASKSAIEKMSGAGGKIILPVVKVEKKEEGKVEKESKIDKNNKKEVKKDGA